MSDTMQELLNSATNTALNNVYTSIPCIIVNIRDGLTTQLVDVQPAINAKLVDGTVKERPVILGVPVVFPASKSSAFTFPISKGDTGLLTFSMRSLEAWKAGRGYPATPLNAAKFDKGDAIFIPGLQPPSEAVNNPAKRLWPHSTQDAVLTHNIGTSQEVELRLKANGGVEINTNGLVKVNSQSAEVVTQSLIIDAANTQWLGDVQWVGTSFTFNGVPFATHTHSGVTPGLGVSGPVVGV